MFIKDPVTLASEHGNSGSPTNKIMQELTVFFKRPRSVASKSKTRDFTSSSKFPGPPKSLSESLSESFKFCLKVATFVLKLVDSHTRHNGHYKIKPKSVKTMMVVLVAVTPKEWLELGLKIVGFGPTRQNHLHQPASMTPFRHH